MISISTLFEKVWSPGEIQANRLIGREKMSGAIPREMIKKGISLPGGKKSNAIISGARTLSSNPVNRKKLGFLGTINKKSKGVVADIGKEYLETPTG